MIAQIASGGWMARESGRYARSDRVDILTGARLFLRLSQGLDTAVIRMPAPTHSKPLLLDEFCQWMREHRGSSERTLYNYGLPIRELIRRFGEDPDKLDAQSLRTFVLSQSRNVGWAKAKRCTTALRMFLRFLIAENRWWIRETSVIFSSSRGNSGSESRHQRRARAAAH
jgi:integrase/recombinase XerD